MQVRGSEAGATVGKYKLDLSISQHNTKHIENVH